MGTALDIFIKLTTSTSSTSSKVSAELEASFNGWGVGVTGSASFSQELNKTASREDFSVVAKSYGTKNGWIPNIGPNDLDRLDKFIDEYQQQMEAAGIAFRMQRYSDLDEYHAIQTACGTTLASFEVNEYFENRLVEVAVEAKLLAAEADERYDVTSEPCTLTVMTAFYAIVEDLLNTPKEQINVQRYNTYKGKLSDLKKRWDSETGKCSTGPSHPGFINVGVQHCNNGWYATYENTSPEECAAGCKSDPQCTHFAVNSELNNCIRYNGAGCGTPRIGVNTYISYWKTPETLAGHCLPNTEANRLDGLTNVSGHTFLSCHERCVNEATCVASTYDHTHTECILYKQCGRTGGAVGWKTLHKNYNVCSIFGCTCQGMSTHYGTDGVLGTWGTAPSDAQTWWTINGCNTRPYTATGYCTPNTGANRISAFDSGYTALSCHKRCLDEAKCVASSHWDTSCVTYRQCGSTGGESAWKTIHKVPACVTFGCTCQGMSLHYGTDGVLHDWGTAPSDAQTWWTLNGCTTRPYSATGYCTPNTGANRISAFNSGYTALSCHKLCLDDAYCVASSHWDSSCVTYRQCDSTGGESAWKTLHKDLSGRRLETTLGEGHANQLGLLVNDKDDVKELAGRAPVV